MPKRGRKPYHHGDLREQLIAAGEAALAELPLADVTLREIARRAGVSHAAPKHHFETLGNLLAEIAARGFEKFVRVLDEAADRNPAAAADARLAAMARRYIQFALENPAVYGLMFGKSSHSVRTPHLGEAATAAWVQLVEGVTPLVGEERATAAAALVFSTVHGYAMLRLEGRHPPHMAGQAVEDEMFAMLKKALTA